MNNDNHVRCADSNCTNTYATQDGMRKHYNREHTEQSMERFPCRFPACERNCSQDPSRIDHERKTHKLYHCNGTKSYPCSLSIKGTQNWKMHQKKHQPYPCTEPDCDKGYAFPKGLREHRKTAHKNNSQSRSNPKPPSKLIPVVPQPEPVFNEATKQPIPNG
ncbi:MAG: hypothetical protein JOS17DRAFT_770604 [Linnemannia elongata]|nr:MAG: hypothetical protein JOS17DRAFT_770604 [Linnemannia elongata]